MSETKVKGGFRPSAQVDGGSYEFDGYIRDARTGTFDYPSGATGVGIFLDIQNEDPEADERKEDFYSCGSVAQITPTEDGLGFLGKDGEPIDGLNKNSNGARLFREVVKGGFQEKDMHVGGDANNVRFLVGQRFHFALVESAKVGGGDAKKLFPTKYLGAVAGQTTTAKATPGAAKAADAADAIVAETVVAVLAEAGSNGLGKADLIQRVGAKLTDAQTKAKAIRSLMSENYIRGIAGVKYDGTTISL